MLLLKSRLHDLRIVAYYLGKICIVVGIAMLIPLTLALFLSEFSVVYDFVIGFSVSLIIGYTLLFLYRTEEDLNWMQGMVTVAVSWLIAAFLGAIPLYLSGHFACFLDAFFEAISGFTTTGLSLTQDLDHLSYGHNLWRHLTQFLGGQGIVVFAISFFFSGASGVFRLYVGEARDERVLPNVINTARFIWRVSLSFFLLGSLMLFAVGIIIGLSPGQSLFDAVTLFMAAFDTGGFAPHSQSILYYHSLPYSMALVFLMVLGALNFKLHYELWHNNRGELFRNTEIRTFLSSVFFLFFFMAISLTAGGVYSSANGLMYAGFFQIISAHTGTGFQTISSLQFPVWGDFPLGILIIAMGLGGGLCSTTGGVKMLRVSIIAKALSQDINRMLLPGSTILVKKIHHIKDLVLNERMIRVSLIITFCYILMYIVGALAGAGLGYPLELAFFESTSAAANVGLSVGITSPEMPGLLKLIYIIQMWTGRLEFIAVFILFGFLVAFIKGK